MGYSSESDNEDEEFNKEFADDKVAIYAAAKDIFKDVSDEFKDFKLIYEFLDLYS